MPLPSDRRRWPWYIRYATLGRLSSKVRRWAAIATHQHANLIFEGDAWIGPRFSLRMFEDGATLRIGRSVEFRRDFSCEVAGTGSVTIGDSCVFAGMSTIQCSTSIEIGSGAIFAHGVLVADGNHEFRRPDLGILDHGYDFRPLKVGPGALILANAVVINDVGERAVVGANSVVTKPIPAYCLAVGAPARVIEYFGPPELDPNRSMGPVEREE